MPTSEGLHVSLGGGKATSKESKSEYKKGDWMWIMTMGMTLGTAITLASAGWMGRLASNFLITAIFLMVCYIVRKAAKFKMSDIANFTITIVTAGVFFFADKFVYQPLFKPYVGELMPLATVQIGSYTYVTAAPAMFIWIPVAFLGLLMLFRYGRGFAMVGDILAVGVGTIALTTVLSGVMVLAGVPWNLDAEWALPPLTPLTSLSWLLGFVYLGIAFLLYYRVKPALYAYLVLQLIGILVSLYFWNLLGLLFNLAIVGYLWLIRKGFRNEAPRAPRFLRGL